MSAWLCSLDWLTWNSSSSLSVAEPVVSLMSACDGLGRSSFWGSRGASSDVVLLSWVDISGGP